MFCPGTTSVVWFIASFTVMLLTEKFVPLLPSPAPVPPFKPPKVCIVPLNGFVV